MRETLQQTVRLLSRKKTTFEKEPENTPMENCNCLDSYNLHSVFDVFNEEDRLKLWITLKS